MNVGFHSMRLLLREVIKLGHLGITQGERQRPVRPCKKGAVLCWNWGSPTNENTFRWHTRRLLQLRTLGTALSHSFNVTSRYMLLVTGAQGFFSKTVLTLSIWFNSMQSVAYREGGGGWGVQSHTEIPNFWQTYAEFPVPWKIHP
jgi:hypothetical protein